MLFNGTVNQSGAYIVDLTNCTESFDINTADESGAENPGHTNAAATLISILTVFKT